MVMSIKSSEVMCQFENGHIAMLLNCRIPTASLAFAYYLSIGQLFKPLFLVNNSTQFWLVHQ